MPLARRKDLQQLNPQSTTNAGLWMDRYLEEQTSDNILPHERDRVNAAKTRLIRSLSVTLRIPEGYPLAYERHAKTLQEQGARLFVATPLGRTVAWLGARGSLEAGLCVERTWGVPMLPSTGLKGLASSSAHLLIETAGWRRSSEPNDESSLHRALFGHTDEAGAVVFSDGWWMPKGNRLPIISDAMTVHHPDYYQGRQQAAPTEMDAPVPIAFAAVRGSFLLGIVGEPHAIDRAAEILALGLRELGIGAKTNAGYGRMELNTAIWSDQGLRLGGRVALPGGIAHPWPVTPLPGAERRKQEEAAERVKVAKEAEERAKKEARDRIISDFDKLLDDNGMVARVKLEEILANWADRIRALDPDQKKVIRQRMLRKFHVEKIIRRRDEVLALLGI